MALFRTPYLCAFALASSDLRGMPHMDHAMNKGSGTFVDHAMSKATETAHDFVAQARLMQQRVAQKQASTRAKLAEQKNAYEEKLAKQENDNTAVVAANWKITTAIDTLKSLNAGLRSDTAKLEKSNAIMRDGIDSLQAKVVTAEQFLVDSLRSSDDKDAEVLKVLDAPKPKPTLNNFLKVTRAIDDETVAGPVSLLELSGSVKQALQEPSPVSAAPEKILNELERSLRSLEEAEREGEVQLKAHFIAAYEVGDRRHSELLEQQRALNETRTTEEALNQSLQIAKEHLIETRTELKRRIHGLDVFARKSNEIVKDALNKAAAVIKATPHAAGVA